MNYNAMDILKENQSKINWPSVSGNIGIFEIDYQELKERIKPFREELMQTCFHPDKLARFLYEYNYDIGEDIYIY